jgi:23S rRNA (pseudouridine1915-N3)-methyltransferase
LLDERGKEYTSRQFSAFIEQKAQTVSKNLIFVVGGPYGFSPAVYSRANGMLSLSKMTFPHEMIRLFFVEQLYRAMSITANLPYHHD